MSNNKEWCNCETITTVARDGLSTCGQCGGMDAYKKSPARIIAEKEALHTHVEICLNLDGKEIRKEFSAEEAGEQIIKLIKLLSADRKKIKKLEAAITKEIKKSGGNSRLEEALSNV